MPPPDKNLAAKTDTELVALTLRQPECFAYLMSRYEKPLCRYISKIARFSADEKDELLQDVFIKTYQNLNDFDTDLKFSSWIYRITHNVAIDRLRRRKTESRAEPLEDGEELFDSIPSELDTASDTASHFTKKHVAAILDTMDPKYRDILVLRFFEEKDYNEISDILEKPLGTVATLLNRAKKQFREKADELQIDLSEI